MPWRLMQWNVHSKQITVKQEVTDEGKLGGKEMNQGC